MEKKLVLVLLMVTLLAGGVFAQNLSAGGGLLIVPGFAEYKYDGGDPQKTNLFGFGVNGFLDITYVEVNLGLLFTTAKNPDNSDYKGALSTDITIGVVGKYPIAVGDKAKIFPFVGLDYNINLEEKDIESGDKRDEFGDYTRADVLSNLRILLGIGFDYDISDSLYFRAEAGYGIVLNNKYQSDLVKDFDAKITQGIIPFKLAVGFRF